LFVNRVEKKRAPRELPWIESFETTSGGTVE